MPDNKSLTRVGVADGRAHAGRRVYVETFGLPPWVCEMCGDPGADLVHHKDEDRDHNALANLMGVHDACHKKHHNVGRVDGPERRKKISEGRTGKGLGPRSETARANMSAALTGRVLSPDTREKLRLAIAKQERRCETCGMTSVPAAIGRHQKYTGHSGWVDLSRYTENQENRNG